MWQDDLKLAEDKFLRPRPELPPKLLNQAQVHIERDYRIASLAMLESDTDFVASPVHFVRDIRTREIKGYAASTDEKLRTSKNSTSLQRLPDQRADFTRGSSRNIPFVFGGMELQSLVDRQMDDTTVADELKLDEGFWNYQNLTHSTHTFRVAHCTAWLLPRHV